MTDEQRKALQNICTRYSVPFNEDDYKPAFDLPDGWVNGWVGGLDHGMTRVEGEWQRTPQTTIFVGCSPDGEISS